MRRLPIRAGLLGIMLLGAATPARADATMFFAVDTEAAPRPTFGVAFGRQLSNPRSPDRPGIGFELEYARTIGDPEAHQPSIGTITVNVVVQTALLSRRTQLYVAGGFGLYGETIGNGEGSGEIETRDFGVGAKITLAGRFKFRLDYRFFLLGAAPDASQGFHVNGIPQRFSAGLSLAF